MRRAIAAAAILFCLSSSVRADIHHLVTQAAHQAGIPANIAHAVIKMESGYQPHIRGAAGEWGLGQIFCQTARSVGFTGDCSALRDPATNLKFSFAYLRLAIDKGGAGCAGVSLYNTGIHIRPVCTAYGQRVMAMAGGKHGLASREVSAGFARPD